MVSPRLALVSGIALVFDASFNVAVSVVTCVEAAAAVLPSIPTAARLAIALGLIAFLAILNLRGVKESVAVLLPILLAFAGSHLVVLGIAIADKLGSLPGVVAAIPEDLAAMARSHGALGATGQVLRAYALGGAIYTGLESLSNGVPILREPKQRSARRTMLLLAGVPALIIAVILTGYLLYDVRPSGDAPLNAILFQQVEPRFGATGAKLAVSIPLLSEAALLVMAAQISSGAPVAVLVVGERTDFARVALKWLEQLPRKIGGVVLASVSLIDAEAVQGEDRLRELEAERRRQLERLARDVRRSGVPVAIEMRRGAEVVEAAAALVRDLLRDRPAESMVVGFRSALDASTVDPILRDDVAVRLQRRLQRDRIPMMVVSVPLEA